MKAIKRILVLSVMLAAIALPVIGFSTDVSAQALQQACQSNPNASICQPGQNGDIGDIIAIVVNTLLYIIGAISVIMIIIGGIRYTTSAGDSSGVTAAKNTILYAVIGLVIAFVSYAIVNWVLNIF
jgi:ABC-type Fe3+ transport system permease subunit